MALQRSCHINVMLTAALLVAATTLPVHASLTLLSGPQTCTHAGNLVTNGSFENGSPGPGMANVQYWATGTTNTPFAVPPGWSSSGPAANYAQWGADSVSSPWSLRSSATLNDGNVGMYFGNGITTFDQAPTFNADGSVSYPATPNSSKGAPVSLWQSVPTHLSPAPSYCLGFWVSGEDAAVPPGWHEGVFGLKVTNVLAGDPTQYFAVPIGSGPQGAARWYEFSFVPLNPLAPVTVEFLNWGHVDMNAYGLGFATELVLDDVIVNAVPEPVSLGLLVSGCVLMLRRRQA